MIHARRGHHGDLGDEHRDFLESPVLREHARLLGRQGRDDPAAVSVFPRALLDAAEQAEDAYPKHIYFNELDKGNHLAA